MKLILFLSLILFSTSSFSYSFLDIIYIVSASKKDNAPEKDMEAGDVRIVPSGFEFKRYFITNGYYFEGNVGYNHIALELEFGPQGYQHIEGEMTGEIGEDEVFLKIGPKLDDIKPITGKIGNDEISLEIKPKLNGFKVLSGKIGDKPIDCRKKVSSINDLDFECN